MKRIMIIFPQIVMEAKEIEVTNEAHDILEVATKQQLQTYIWNNMTAREQENSGGKETVNSLVWSGACKIQYGAEPSKGYDDTSPAVYPVFL